jgi:hypothetical protein
MALRWYAAVSLALVVAYPLLSDDLRTIPFLLVALGAVRRVRRRATTSRCPGSPSSAS